MPTEPVIADGADSLQPGAMRWIIVKEKRVLLIRTKDGSFFALRGICPHRGADLAHGRLTGITQAAGVGEYKYAREGQILRCPWHRIEFDVATGQSIVDPLRLRVRTYPVTVEGREVYIHGVNDR